MSLDADALYALLPAVYRTRDAAAGGQLRALFGVLAAQSDLVSQNIAQLYDDQFIETCAPWAIPYVGDLIGYNAVYELAGVTDSRAEVANTIGYRRRKGTKIALQQVAIDTSGRPAVVVEEFQRLITTESMRLVRPGHAATVSLRNGPLLRALGHASGNGISDSPFDAANRTVDVRRIAPRFVTPACGCTATPGAPGPDLRPLDTALHGPGRANITDVAVHLWRWQAFGVNDAPAFAVDARRYKVSPLAQDLPLFTPLRLPESFTALLSRDDVPEPIGRAELARLYGAAVTLVADGVPVDASRVYGANLADRPGGAWCEVPAGKVAIDPELGRIQFAAGVPGAAVADDQLLVRVPGRHRRRALRPHAGPVRPAARQPRVHRDHRVGRLPDAGKRGRRVERLRHRNRPCAGDHRAARHRRACRRPDRGGRGHAASGQRARRWWPDSRTSPGTAP